MLYTAVQPTAESPLVLGATGAGVISATSVTHPAAQPFTVMVPITDDAAGGTGTMYYVLYAVNSAGKVGYSCLRSYTPVIVTQTGFAGSSPTFTVNGTATVGGPTGAAIAVSGFMFIHGSSLSPLPVYPQVPTGSPYAITTSAAATPITATFNWSSGNGIGVLFAQASTGIVGYSWPPQNFFGGGPCLLRDTTIAVWAAGRPGTGRCVIHKAIQDVWYDDDLVVWDFDEGCLAAARPLWIKAAQDVGGVDNPLTWYSQVTLNNGTTLNTVGLHRVFDATNGMFTPVHAHVDAYGARDGTGSGVGMTTRVLALDAVVAGDDTETETPRIPSLAAATIVSIDPVHVTPPSAPVQYYNIYTDRHANLFANGVLTSCRYNNRARIDSEHMTFCLPALPTPCACDCCNADGVVLRAPSPLTQSYVVGLRMSSCPFVATEHLVHAFACPSLHKQAILAHASNHAAERDANTSTESDNSDSDSDTDADAHADVESDAMGSTSTKRCPAARVRVLALQGEALSYVKSMARWRARAVLFFVFPQDAVAAARARVWARALTTSLRQRHDATLSAVYMVPQTSGAPVVPCQDSEWWETDVALDADDARCSVCAWRNTYSAALHDSLDDARSGVVVRWGVIVYGDGGCDSAAEPDGDSDQRLPRAPAAVLTCATCATRTRTYDEPEPRKDVDDDTGMNRFISQQFQPAFDALCPWHAQ